MPQKSGHHKEIQTGRTCILKQKVVMSQLISSASNIKVSEPIKLPFFLLIIQSSPTVKCGKARVSYIKIKEWDGNSTFQRKGWP